MSFDLYNDSFQITKFKSIMLLTLMILTGTFRLYKILTTYGILVQERFILFFLYQLARAHIVHLTLNVYYILNSRKKNLNREKIGFLDFNKIEKIQVK